MDLDQIDEFLAELPNDPLEGYLELHRRMHEAMSTIPEVDQVNFAQIHITLLREWANNYNFEFPNIANGDFSPQSYAELNTFMSNLRSNVETQNLTVAIKRKLRERVTPFGYANLTGEEKDELRDHISRIKKIIDETHLDTKKKNSIILKIKDLELEIERYGTRTDAFFGLMADLGLALGNFSENARPLTKEVRSVLKIIYRARARTEDVSLPPGEDLPSLPPPEND